MQALDWSDFQVFQAIVDAGQLTRAGAMLNLDGTTVSRRLRRLEARVGAILFEQTRTGQVLTEAGERLLVLVEAMATAAARIEARGDSEAGSRLSGVLRISASEGFGTWFLAARMPDLTSSHPALTIDLVASSGFLSPSKREADIAVTLSRPTAGPVTARKLSDYTLRLYAAQDYLAHAGTPRSRLELRKGHSLTGYIPDLIYAPELNYLDEICSGLEPNIRSSSINAQHHLLAAGAGIGVLPCFIGDRDDRLVRILPELTITRSFWLVTHKDTHQLARVRAGRDWIIQAVRQHRERLLPAG